MSDAIILAAGNGSRLEGIAATGMKPLLVVNGEALIARLVRQAEATISGKVIIVTSPVNTQAITNLVGTSPTYVVQPEAAGPGEALLRGLEACHTAAAMVLMGDNLMDDDDITKVVHAGLGLGVIYTGNPMVACRFTRVRHMGTDFLLESEEGPEFYDDRGPWILWCGPLYVPVKNCREALLRAQAQPHHEGELKIGPYLGRMFRKQPTEFTKVNARDIGIAEELQ